LVRASFLLGTLLTESKLFHQEAVQASATVTAAFTAQLKAMDASLEKASDIVSDAAKVVDAVAQILPYI
jgi:hypothetical protein